VLAGLSEKLPELVEALAREAGREILAVYASAFSMQTKPDASPLTEADLRAHGMIAASLARLTPDIPVLSEESVIPDYAQRARWQRYWLVDPLDGTKEFVSRNGEFTVNIALIHAQRPVLGVVHIPVSDITYSGIVGVGAWRQEPDADRTDIGVRVPAATPLRVVGSRSHGNPALNKALHRLGPHELRIVGSSIKLCLIAEGSADLYPRLGPTSEWDIAAGQAVVEAAGGYVVRISDHAPLRYNTKADLLNPHFIAGADAALLARWPPR
jgi:3'(2'), 5'-bisphosphate nucleotidase